VGELNSWHIIFYAILFEFHAPNSRVLGRTHNGHNYRMEQTLTLQIQFIELALVRRNFSIKKLFPAAQLTWIMAPQGASLHVVRLVAS
jgi:hypothetical protein